MMFQRANFATHFTAPHCTTLRRTAPHCTALHRTALHCTALHRSARHRTAPHCTALHGTELQCTALHHTAPHHNTLQQHTATQQQKKCKTMSPGILQHTDTATHCNTLQHTATHCNTLQQDLFMTMTPGISHLSPVPFSNEMPDYMHWGGRCVAACCSVLQCAAVFFWCCIVLQCVAGSLQQRDA